MLRIAKRSCNFIESIVYVHSTNVPDIDILVDGVSNFLRSNALRSHVYDPFYTIAFLGSDFYYEQLTTYHNFCQRPIRQYGTSKDEQLSLSDRLCSCIGVSRM